MCTCIPEIQIYHKTLVYNIHVHVVLSMSCVDLLELLVIREVPKVGVHDLLYIFLV